MSAEFRIRDWLHPPIKILQEAGVHRGMTVLDFGCGPGGFSLAAAQLVGPEGLVFAVDIHPLAVKSVQRAANKEGVNNIRTILGDGISEIRDGTVDIALCYDVLHDLQQPATILAEFHRVLQTDGVLSVSDHHMREAPLLAAVTGGSLFYLDGSKRWGFQFRKTETSGAAP